MAPTETVRTSKPRTVGILHPGAMGASVAAAAVAAGHRVLWCPEGRSPATRARSEAAGLNAASFDELCTSAEVLVSVCPPASAAAVATSVAAAGFAGVYVDANAVAPAASVSLGRRFADRFVDGGIVGPPAWSPGNTRLYLSGERADLVTELFAGSALEAIVIGAEIGAASALKMSYASWTKGSAALLLAVRAVAKASGVEDLLMAEWARSQSGLESRSAATAAGVAPKAWRFAGEMEEIADTFAGVGVPDGFFRSAAELYERMASSKDQLDPPVTVADTTEQIIQSRVR